jgi:hypothetical protein
MLLSEVPAKRFDCEKKREVRVSLDGVVHTLLRGSRPSAFAVRSYGMVVYRSRRSGSIPALRALRE